MSRVSQISKSPPYAVEQALTRLGKNIKTARLRRKLTQEELAGKILMLLMNRDQARAMGTRGRRLVHERFELGRMVLRIENLYQEVLAQKRIG